MNSLVLQLLHLVFIHVNVLGEELAAFEVVISQMLEDVQQRLVYRAQVS